MAELLKVEGLKSGYGEAVVVQGVDLTLAEGESLALLGRNWLAGDEITTLPAYQRAAAGIGWVPQERNIFKSLTFDENLTAVARPGAWTVARAYEMFPRLA